MTGARAKLPPASRFMALQYKLYDNWRHRQAYELAGKQGTAPDFEHLRGARQCVVVTFKRSGEPVPTPVNFGLSDDGKLYFRSEPHVAKVKRMRRDPHVRVWPCTMRGKPLGPSAEGRARILPEEENERAYEIVASNWRADMRVIERGYDRIGVPTVYVEIAPASSGREGP